MTDPYEPTWPVQMLSALRLGRPLVVEVPAGSSGRRAFVRIAPVHDEQDAQAEREHWVRSRSNRRFVVSHREFREEYLDTMDYDIGAVDVARFEVTGEEALVAQLRAWRAEPSSLRHPWTPRSRPDNRADPKRDAGPPQYWDWMPAAADGAG